MQSTQQVFWHITWCTLQGQIKVQYNRTKNTDGAYWFQELDPNPASRIKWLQLKLEFGIEIKELHFSVNLGMPMCKGNKYRESGKRCCIKYRVEGYGRWYRGAKIIGERWKGWLESSCDNAVWDGRFKWRIRELYCWGIGKELKEMWAFCKPGGYNGRSWCRMDYLTDERRWEKVSNDILTT